jgi:hypothetical protein
MFPQRPPRRPALSAFRGPLAYLQLPCRPERRERSAFPSPLPQKPAALSPFPAILTSNSQTVENAMTLSPVSATLTSHVRANPFVCHSYKKQPGWGYTLPVHAISSALHSPRSILYIALSLRAILARGFLDSTERIRNPFRIRLCEKTRGRGSSNSNWDRLQSVLVSLNTFLSIYKEGLPVSGERTTRSTSGGGRGRRVRRQCPSAEVRRRNTCGRERPTLRCLRGFLFSAR